MAGPLPFTGSAKISSAPHSRQKLANSSNSDRAFAMPGIPVIVEDDTKFCFQRHIGLIRPKAATQSAWLYYLLLSPQSLKQANEGATGTAQKIVSLKVLRSLKVPRVPPPLQTSAVASLDALRAEAQRLASLYRQKLAELDALKKSLLDRAFSGLL
jgi:type I restriction enzyme S subunit